MKEMQIQLYWLNHSISLSNLVTTEGKKLVILFPGHLNLNQGPDFLHGKILIENLEWVGSVEVHHKCSDWYLHNHASDTHYQNFILHVIWENDCKNFEHCQVLELSRYITSEKIQSLEQNNNTGFFLTNDLSFQMLEQLGLERVERKSNEVLIQVRAKGGDWDFVFWKRMAYSFGLPLNGNEFERRIY